VADLHRCRIGSAIPVQGGLIAPTPAMRDEDPRQAEQQRRFV
jgi:hypothetical protein